MVALRMPSSFGIFLNVEVRASLRRHMEVATPRSPSA
jgi:hypothetical protein